MQYMDWDWPALTAAPAALVDEIKIHMAARGHWDNLRKERDLSSSNQGKK